jgi:ANTAR domain
MSLAHDDSAPAGSSSSDLPSVTLARTSRGWSVVSPAGAASAGDLIEGLSLADLIAEEFGALVEPDRTARRSARGPGQAAEPAEDSPEGRIAALERTVAQLEHALAARVSTERAIGVLAERNGTNPRAAFESLRREARSSGRPVAELAREVLAGLERLDAPLVVASSSPATGPSVASPATRPAALHTAASSPSPAVAAADGRA